MPYRVVVVGAGFGGIGMAIALKQAGIEDFVVLDKADDLGGTWRDNSYPGLSCDVPSQLYSFSFRPWRWSRRFPPREEILAYLHGLVAERGLGRTCASAPGSRPPSSTRAARVWNAHPRRRRHAAGDRGRLRRRPARPACPARHRVAGTSSPGPSWHSGRWNHDVDLAGRRVAVIGTGASAIQFVPEIAKVAGARRRLPAHRPLRAAQGRPAVPATPSRRCSTGCPWCARPTGCASSSTASCSPAASSCRRSCLPRRCSSGAASSRAQIADPELRAKCVPDYVMGCKRVAVLQRLVPGAGAAQRRARHRPDRADRPGRRGHRRRHDPPGGRDHLRHGVQGARLPGADAGDRPGRPPAARGLAGRGRRPTSASRSPGSRTSSCSTGRTPTSAATRSSTCSRARSATCSARIQALEASAWPGSTCAPRCRTRSTPGLRRPAGRRCGRPAAIAGTRRPPGATPTTGPTTRSCTGTGSGASTSAEYRVMPKQPAAAVTVRMPTGA